MATPLCRGKIVWVEVADPQGRNPKRRPSVILTATADIRPDGQVLVAGISTQLGAGTPGMSVPLPYNPTGQVSTKLRRACEVVCDWLATVPVGALESTEGYVPGAQMIEVLRKVAEVLAPPLPPPTSPPPSG